MWVRHVLNIEAHATSGKGSSEQSQDCDDREGAPIRECCCLSSSKQLQCHSDLFRQLAMGTGWLWLNIHIFTARNPLGDGLVHHEGTRTHVRSCALMDASQALLLKAKCNDRHVSNSYRRRIKASTSSCLPIMVCHHLSTVLALVACAPLHAGFLSFLFPN